jgi:hypothetical protein
VIVSPQKSSNTLESPVRAPTGQSRKPKADVYTILLVLALLAILTAIAFLWMELAYYDYKTKGMAMILRGDRAVATSQRSVASGQWLDNAQRLQSQG